MTSVDENNGEVCSRRTCNHVARILHVTWAVHNDKGTGRCSEIAVRYVDGDALFPLGAQTIGEQ